MGVFIKGMSADMVRLLIGNVMLANCELIEVKTPHGRLIDADALSVENVGRLKEVIDIVAIDLMVENAPTVIESEE